MATNAQAQERKEGGLAQASFVGVLRAKPEKSRRIACLSLWPSFFVYGLFMASLACLSTKRRASSLGHHGRHGHHGYQDTNQQNFESNFYKRCSKIAASTQRLQFILFFFWPWRLATLLWRSLLSFIVQRCCGVRIINISSAETYYFISYLYQNL